MCRMVDGRAEYGNNNNNNNTPMVGDAAIDMIS